jgi:hypothetical protein
LLVFQKKDVPTASPNQTRVENREYAWWRSHRTVDWLLARVELRTKLIPAEHGGDQGTGTKIEEQERKPLARMDLTN